MITCHCQCGGQLRAPDEYAGKHAKCPRCGQSIPIPFRRDGGGIGPKTKIVTGAIGAGALLAIAFSIWFFAIRDTWEPSHYARVRALQDEAADLRAQSDLPGASAKLHEILAMVGDRKLKDVNFRSAMGDIRASAVEIDGLLVARELPKPVDDPAQQRAAKGTAGADSRATIIGRAWVVKGGGSSDVPRGMTVYLLSPDCSGTAIRQYYQQVAEGARNSAAAWRERAIDMSPKGGGFGRTMGGGDVGGDPLNLGGESEQIRREAEEVGRLLSEAAALDKYWPAIVAAAQRIPERMDVHEAYLLLREVGDSDPRDKGRSGAKPLCVRFGTVVRECAQRTAQVSTDGKFSLEGIESGKYYLYAYWATESNSIEWLIPLNAWQSGTITQELSSSTAKIVWNKYEEGK